MTSIAEYRASPTRVIELRRSVVPLTAIALLGVLIWRMPTDYAFRAYAFCGRRAHAHLARLAGGRDRRIRWRKSRQIRTIVRLTHSSAPGPWLSSIAIGFGGAAILAAALTVAMASDEARPPALLRLAAVLTMPAFVVVAGIFLGGLGRLAPDDLRQPARRRGSIVRHEPVGRGCCRPTLRHVVVDVQDRLRFASAGTLFGRCCAMAPIRLKRP